LPEKIVGRDSLPVYILSGGRSSRFGSDKARMLIGGQPLLLGLARTLQPFASALTVVADVVDKYQDLGLRTIADRTGGLGPIGGLITALDDAVEEEMAEEKWLLVTACDQIGLRPEWIKLLLSRAVSRIEAVAFKGERWESLLTLFHTSIRARVEENIARRRLAIWRLLEELNTQAVPLPHDWKTLSHINTPEDLARYLSQEQQ